MSSFSILPLMFCRGYENGSGSEARFGLKILNFKFSGDADVLLRFLVDAYLRF